MSPAGEKNKAKGLANAHAAVAMVREWGGMLKIDDLRRNGFGRGARRAVKLGLLVSNRGAYVLATWLGEA